MKAGEESMNRIHLIGWLTVGLLVAVFAAGVVNGFRDATGCVSIPAGHPLRGHWHP